MGISAKEHFVFSFKIAKKLKIKVLNRISTGYKQCGNVGKSFPHRVESAVENFLIIAIERKIIAI